MRWVLSVMTILGCGAMLFSATSDGDLPDGKGKEVLLKMCTNCHGLEEVTIHRYPKKYWTSVVDDMVSRGAEGSEDDANTVIGYLSRNFGKPININTSSAKEIEAGLSFTAAQAEGIVRYRADNGAFKAYEDLSKVPGLDAGLLEEQKKNIMF